MTASTVIAVSGLTSSQWRFGKAGLVGVGFPSTRSNVPSSFVRSRTRSYEGPPGG